MIKDDRMLLKDQVFLSSLLSASETKAQDLSMVPAPDQEKECNNSQRDAHSKGMLYNHGPNLWVTLLLLNRRAALCLGPQ